ncbi:MAG: hypothetical protein A2X58_05215 [Nitrospirae bacterium GWC2_56_14]|nr:MAG: hypothetical protein A2X58_05215 [Nitrospirae bacterium GWC2_56_14]
MTQSQKAFGSIRYGCGRSEVLTGRGRGVAVVRSLKDYEEETEERAFMQGIVKGMMDLEEGREISLSEAKKRLGLP